MISLQKRTNRKSKSLLERRHLIKNHHFFQIYKASDILPSEQEVPSSDEDNIMLLVRYAERKKTQKKLKAKFKKWKKEHPEQWKEQRKLDKKLREKNAQQEDEIDQLLRCPSGSSSESENDARIKQLLRCPSGSSSESENDARIKQLLRCPSGSSSESENDSFLIPDNQIHDEWMVEYLSDLESSASEGETSDPEEWTGSDSEED